MLRNDACEGHSKFYNTTQITEVFQCVRAGIFAKYNEKAVLKP